MEDDRFPGAGRARLNVGTEKNDPPSDPANGTGNTSEEGQPVRSFGSMGDHHWSRSRRGKNKEALDYLRWRSHAPGVEEGGSERNHYCMHCHGVIPLAYDQREPADETPRTCPHCNAALEPRVRAMFNWVEIDQPPPSDRALKWTALGVVAIVIAAVVWWLL